MCGLWFRVAATFRIHCFSHHHKLLPDQVSDDNLKCPECSEKFLNWSDHVSHAAIHGEPMLPLQVVENSDVNKRDPLRKPHKCELCYKSFSTEERLKVNIFFYIPLAILYRVIYYLGFLRWSQKRKHG